MISPFLYITSLAPVLAHAILSVEERHLTDGKAPTLSP